MGQDLYESDPLYHRTPIESPIPPPNFDVIDIFKRAGGNAHHLPSPISFYLPESESAHAALPSIASTPQDITITPQKQILASIDHSDQDRSKTLDNLFNVRIGKAEYPDYDAFGDKIAVEENEKLLSEIREIPKATLDSCLKAFDAFAMPVSHKIIYNRESFELAEIDCAFNLISNHLSAKTELTYLDISRKYGVFSNYINWRAKHKVRDGWGYSFTAEQTLIRYSAGRSGMKTGLGSLNLYSEAHRKDFVTKIQSTEGHCGIDFIVADTTYSFLKEAYLIREEHTQRIFIDVLLLVHTLLAEQGSFVVKLVDTLAPTTIQLIYLTYISFERIALFRCKASDPLSAHVYLVCFGFKKGSNTARVKEHLERLDEDFRKLESSGSTLIPSPFKSQSGRVQTLSQTIEQGADSILDVIQPEVPLNDATFSDPVLNKNLKTLMDRSKRLRDIIDLSKQPSTAHSVQQAQIIYHQILRECHL